MAQTFTWKTETGYWEAGTINTTLIMSSTTTEESIITGSTAYYTFPSFQIKSTFSNTGLPEYWVNTSKSYTPDFLDIYPAPAAGASATAYASFSSIRCDTLSTSKIFNSSNPTSRTVNYEIYLDNSGYRNFSVNSYYDGTWWPTYTQPASKIVICTVPFTLNAPPNISTTAVSGGTTDANGVKHYWKDISSVNCYVYKSWAQYGGTIAEGTLTVGNQSATVTDITSSSKSARITLGAVGTFTPTLAVTDSRGQISTKELTGITVEEYVSPTANWGTVQKDKTGYYANQTTVSVTVSDISVMTGYEATRVTFRVGTQVETVDLEQGQDSATLSMLLTQTGTLSTRVGITTTANLTSWHYYDDIVAEEYVSPSVNFQANRAKNNGAYHGILDDEGEEILITATFDYLDFLELLEPTTTITEQSEVTSSAVITWYESWDATTGVSDAVNWASYSPQSPITLYGLMTGYGSTTGFDTAYSYQTTITPRDEISSGTAISQTTANAYYTIDFQAGGREIAFGAPANDDVADYPEGLFKCAMSFKLKDNLFWIGTQSEYNTAIADDKIPDHSIVIITDDNIADYVMDEGTSGIWKYRKWESGVAECWGKWTGTLSHYAQVTFYAYNTGAIPYPSGFFIEEPNTHFSGRIGSGFCLTGTLYNCSKDNFYGYAMSTASGSQSCTFFIYAIGRWK